MKPKRSFLARKCTLNVSACLIICGVIIILTWRVFFDLIIDNKLTLTPKSLTHDSWKKLPFTVPTDFYFFNWTNPEDVYDATVKPKFQETGPYRFSEINEKTNIVWNENGTVTFRHVKFWYFDDDEENGNLSDRITLVNPVALSMVYVVRLWNYVIHKAVSISLSELAPTISIERSVGQLLFEGYPDPLIKLANTLPFLVDQPLPFKEKFGFTYMRNGSADFNGIFNMGTGEKIPLGKLHSWNYWTQTPYYDGNCGRVGGSAGEFFDRHPNKQSINLFSSDMCRILTLNYVGETTVENILGYKYALEDYTLDNGTIYPENKCFCNGECTPSGLLNVSNCRHGAPFFISLPHFYKADPYYLNSVDGLKPEMAKHEFYITLEHTTGIPLEMMASLQVNMLMQPVPDISLYENVPRIFLPIVWSQQKIKISENEAFKLKLLLSIPVICLIVEILLICIGLILLSFYIYTRYIVRRKNKEIFAYQQQSIPLTSTDQEESLKQK